MILSHRELRKIIDDEHVQFSPHLENDQIGEASIDLRLGFRFTRLKENAQSLTVSVADGLSLPEDLWVSRELNERDAFGKEEKYELDPDEFVLAMTYETVSLPRDIIGRVEGRSTYARVGLSMHQTAPWIQPGWNGQIILEIMNNGPLKISLQPLKDRPCQLTLFYLKEAVPDDVAYGSRKTDYFQGQTHAFPPRK